MEIDSHEQAHDHYSTQPHHHTTDEIGLELTDHMDGDRHKHSGAVATEEELSVGQDLAALQVDSNGGLDDDMEIDSQDNVNFKVAEQYGTCFPEASLGVQDAITQLEPPSEVATLEHHLVAVPNSSMTIQQYATTQDLAGSQPRSEGSLIRGDPDHCGGGEGMAVDMSTHMPVRGTSVSSSPETEQDHPLLPQGTNGSSDPEAGPNNIASYMSEKPQARQDTSQSHDIAKPPGRLAASRSSSPLTDSSKIPPEPPAHEREIQQELAESDEQRANRESRKAFEGHYQTFLSKFRAEGVPTNESENGFSIIANITSDGLANVMNFVMGMRKELDDYRLYSEQKFSLYENEIGRLRGTEALAKKTADDFVSYQKRLTQRKVREEIEKIAEELKKLRAPDVSLEDLKSYIDNLEKRIETAEAKYDVVNKGWEDKKMLITSATRKLHKDVKDRNDEAKDLRKQVQNFEQELEDVKEDVHWLKEQQSVEEKRSIPELRAASVDALTLIQEKLDKHEVAVNTELQEFGVRQDKIQNDLDVLRDHVEDFILRQSHRLVGSSWALSKSSQNRRLSPRSQRPCMDDFDSSQAFMATQFENNPLSEDFKQEQLHINDMFQRAIRDFKQPVEAALKIAENTSTICYNLIKETKFQAEQVERHLKHHGDRIRELEEMPVMRKRQYHIRSDDYVDTDIVMLEQNLHTLDKEFSQLKAHVLQRNDSVEHQFEDINAILKDSIDNMNMIESAFKHKLRVEKKERIEAELTEFACRSMSINVLARNTDELWRILNDLKSVRESAQAADLRCSVSYKRPFI
jgi:hypothetical protein